MREVNGERNEETEIHGEIMKEERLRDTYMKMGERD